MVRSDAYSFAAIASMPIGANLRRRTCGRRQPGWQPAGEPQPAGRHVRGAVSRRRGVYRGLADDDVPDVRAPCMRIEGSAL